MPDIANIVLLRSVYFLNILLMRNRLTIDKTIIANTLISMIFFGI